MRIDRGRHRLVLSLHHIITDGWSNDILVRDLAALYDAEVSGRNAALPELEIQYVDYSEWQREQSENGHWTGDLAYWVDRLRDAPDHLDIATDFPRAAARSEVGGVVALMCDHDLERDVDAMCRREGATLFVALLAAFKSVLRVYTGRDDLVVGSASANRDRAEVEGVIGFFVNTLALRTDLSGDPTLGELLRRVRSTTLDALAHQSLPFDHLVAVLRPVRRAGVSPLVQAMCVVEEGSQPEIALPDLQFRVRPGENDLAKFDLTLAARRTHEGLELSLGYAVDLFAPQRMQQMLGHVRNALAAMAIPTHPSIR
jgi:hypothetical protein